MSAGYSVHVRDPRDVVHVGRWTYGEWVGRTACGREFVAARNQWQRHTPEGLLLLQNGPYGGHRDALVLLETPIDCDCMTCLVLEAQEGQTS